MEDLGVTGGDNRPIKLFRLTDWAWVYPGLSPFILFVAANASADDEIEIRRFADEAVKAGCAYVCTWGEGCSRIHDLFDLASIDAGRFVMSSWHDDESLPEALWFALFNAWPDDEGSPHAGDVPVVLAVEDEWLAEVRDLVADQEELARLVVRED